MYANGRMPEGAYQNSNDDNQVAQVLREDIVAGEGSQSGGSIPSPFDRFGNNRHHAWHMLVQNYLRHQLTFDSDKLDALAGIIQSLAPSKGSAAPARGKRSFGGTSCDWL